MTAHNVRSVTVTFEGNPKEYHYRFPHWFPKPSKGDKALVRAPGGPCVVTIRGLSNELIGSKPILSIFDLGHLKLNQEQTLKSIAAFDQQEAKIKANSW